MRNIFKKLLSKKNNKKNKSENNKINLKSPQQLKKQLLPKALQDKMAILQTYIDKNADLVNRSFYIGKNRQLEGRAIYLEGVIDVKTFNEHILESLMIKSSGVDFSEQKDSSKMLDNIYKSYITVGKAYKINQSAEMINKIFDGMVILLFEGINDALVIDIHGGSFRAVEEPATEKTIKGSREGFVENLDTNLGILRRRLRDPRLVIQKTIVGKRTRSVLALAYIDDVADPGIVKQVQEKINAIDIDGVPGSSYIEELLESNPHSLFPQFWGTERADKAVAQLLEGRVAIIVNGSPYTIFVPSLFVEFFQASEDYYEKYIVGSYGRILKFLAFFISISAPAVYIALVNFQPELIPVKLLIPLAEARKEVPFPIMVEVLVQEIIIQLVIESGLRVPSSVGQTVGVVAGIVLGQAAISAKLATPAVIIIITVTTIGTFSIPSASLVQATRIIRLPLLFLAAIFGLFGFALGWIILITHLTALENFGIPYLSPIAPTRYSDLKDVFWRKPIWKMNQRPVSIPVQDQRRQSITRGEEKTHGK